MNYNKGDVDGGYPITRIETTANDKFKALDKTQQLFECLMQEYFG